MTPSTMILPDGSQLERISDRSGRLFGIDSQSHRTVTFDGDTSAGGRLVDSGGQVVREVVPQPTAASGAVSCGNRPRGRSTGNRAGGERWANLNTFVDTALAKATEAEVRVWLVLYREVRPGGLARVGMTDIAHRAGMTRRAVVKGINGLKRHGLIEVAARGSINGTPNSYRLLNSKP
jgi:hypothetical protein